MQRPILWLNQDTFAGRMPPVLSVDRPAKRLRGKQPVQAYTAGQVLAGENPNAVKRTYLVTLSHPRAARSADGVPLRAPKEFSREAVRDLVLRCCREPDHDPSYLRMHPGFVPVSFGVLNLVVFREFHKVDEAAGVAEMHYHIAVLLEEAHRYMPIKRALLNNYGLAAHFSCSHDDFSSAVRYGVRATPEKPRAALDPAPLVWGCRAPVPGLEEMANEPTTGRALAARRTALVQAASEAGKGEPRISEVDIWPLIVKSGIKHSPDDPCSTERFVSYVKKNCSPQTVSWLFKNREKIPKLITDTWAWEDVDRIIADVGRTRQQCFEEAKATPCICGGRWAYHVEESFRLNKINAPRLCAHVLRSIYDGRSEAVPVIVLVGRYGGEGKSLFFDPLRTLFGDEHTFQRPPGGQFALMDLPTKKVALLNEWEFMSESLPLALQPLWLEGKPVPICLPQNERGSGRHGNSGHDLYRGTAPIFVTAPLDAIQRLMYTKDSRASMLLRRLELYDYAVKIPKPPPPRINACSRCFVDLVCRYGSPVVHSLSF